MLSLLISVTVLASACTAVTPPYRGRDFRPTMPVPARPAEENKGGVVSGRARSAPFRGREG
jgi:hypothetical protein